MTRFIEIEQDGKIATVNPDHVVLVLPSHLVGTTDLMLTNGLKVTVKGNVKDTSVALDERPYGPPEQDAPCPF